MSDSPMEQESPVMPTMLARGDVLVVGLGLGLFPLLLRARNRAVKSVTIIEQNQEVVDLVYNKIKSTKTSVKVADGEAFLADTDDRYDFIFIDVWPDPIALLREVDRWNSLAKRCLKPNGEARCWLQELYDRVKAKLPKEPINPTSAPGIHEPCLFCGKKMRGDYAGLCADCADGLEVSELFIGRSTNA